MWNQTLQKKLETVIEEWGTMQKEQLHRKDVYLPQSRKDEIDQKIGFEVAALLKAIN